MRRIQVLNLVLLLAGWLLLSGCEKLLMDKNPTAGARDCFESMWQTVDEKYSYFSEKNITWDSVYAHYDPLVSDGMSDAALFSVLDSMLYDLRDGHVNLVSPFNLSRNWSWYLDFPQNFSYDILERHYLADDYRIAGGIRYRMIDSIGYIYCSSFSSAFTEDHLDEIFTFLAPAKGVIMDVRDNGGGSLGRAFSLARRFTTRQQTVLYTREKTGPGHDDFGNDTQYSLSPGSRPSCSVPVALLTNRQCYSATNTFTAIMSQYEQVTQIGDQTGGGGGIPVDYELPNGWRYRFSASQSFINTPAGLYEIEAGISPDIRMDLDPQNLLNGVDDILEAGLAELR